MPMLETARGIRIYYETLGRSREGTPPLVLLHGLSSSTRIWEYQVQELSRHFRIINFDYPGHGRSQWLSRGEQRLTGGYSLPGLVTVTRDVLDALDIPRAHLMGLSLGCAVGLSFACQAPERVTSLVLQGPVGGFLPPWHPGAWGNMAYLGTYLLLLFTLWKTLGKARTCSLINALGPQTHGYYPLLDDIEREVDPMAIPALAPGLLRPPYVGHLHEVSCPILVVRGKDDPAPLNCPQYIQRHVGGSCVMVEIPGARHIVGVEQPRAFNQAVLAFLERQCLLPSY